MLKIDAETQWDSLSIYVTSVVSLIKSRVESVLLFTKYFYNLETIMSYKGISPIKVRKLGHFIYEVSDIERTTKFWQDVMGFDLVERNKKGMVFFRYGADHHAIGLTPMQQGKRPERDLNSLQAEHLAFEVEDTNVLQEAKKYFIENNIPIVFEGRKGAGCNTSINFLDPDGYQFEIYCGMDQIGQDGKLRPSSMFKPKDPLEEAISDPVEPNW